MPPDNFARAQRCLIFYVFVLLLVTARSHPIAEPSVASQLPNGSNDLRTPQNTSVQLFRDESEPAPSIVPPIPFGNTPTAHVDSTTKDQPIPADVHSLSEQEPPPFPTPSPPIPTTPPPPFSPPSTTLPPPPSPLPLTAPTPNHNHFPQCPCPSPPPNPHTDIPFLRYHAWLLERVCGPFRAFTPPHLRPTPLLPGQPDPCINAQDVEKVYAEYREIVDSTGKEGLPEGYLEWERFLREEFVPLGWVEGV
ncbi:hypothetical protein BJ508DRAFT_326159 [Ascobolus immersus RN42]|uniref:Uncharacterized protein n=1 Tax=Ascobolus immersus RN42 TaxID=1160509 RepID=A0A3N4I6K0_ASCIM|nr:hypothetical protein BJ508DRAFT_326159 [Ascobolus immersus RN42]